jgi:hypothetical protein
MNRNEKLSNLKSRVFGKQQLNKNRIMVDEFIRRDGHALPLDRVEYDLLSQMKNSTTYTKVNVLANTNVKRINRIAFYCGLRTVIKFDFNQDNWVCIPIDENFMIENEYEIHFQSNVSEIIQAAVELEYVYKAKVAKFDDDQLMREYEKKTHGGVISALNEIGNSFTEQIKINKNIHDIITNFETVILQLSKMDIMCDTMKSLVNNKFNDNVKNCDIVSYVLRKKTNCKV